MRDLLDEQFSVFLLLLFVVHVAGDGRFRDVVRIVVLVFQREIFR